MEKETSEEALTRRQFLKRGFLAGVGLGVASYLGIQLHRGLGTGLRLGLAEMLKGSSEEPTPIAGELHEARYYRSLEDNVVQCQVCFRRCTVREGGRSFCRNKVNLGGKYYTLVYAKPCAVQIDPVEKEPSFHMLPGGTIFCTATASCNNRCRHCQNWHISQKSVEETVNLFLPPKAAVEMALEQECDAVSFTYSEPTVFYEYMFDVAKQAKEAGLKALFHTNGSMNPEPLAALLEHMDAVTVDLKAFTSKFYREVSSSQLEPVLQTIVNIRESGRHLEIVNLVIPTLNDDMEDIKRMCVWIKENVGDDVPLHFTRFFPAHKLTSLPPTPIETLEKAAEIADGEGLQYVYIGNVPGHDRNSTFCPKCGERVIHRVHFSVRSLDVENGRCRFCGHEIPGIWWEDEEDEKEALRQKRLTPLLAPGAT